MESGCEEVCQVLVGVPFGLYSSKCSMWFIQLYHKGSMDFLSSSFICTFHGTEWAYRRVEITTFPKHYHQTLELCLGLGTAWETKENYETA